jgi:NAD(P)-dependent dehydrogenase (short-subunit alcohol dehydrogenase family)
MQCMQHLDVNSVVDATMERFGKIGMLINKVGILQYKNLVDMSEEGWANTININLVGAFLFYKAFLPHMLKSNSGVIIKC